MEGGDSMKFVMSNKEEILGVLSEVEKQICSIRFALARLPQEFEFSPVEESKEVTDDQK